MKVRLNGHASRSFHINMAVPSVSILEYTLFLLFSNDLTNVINPPLRIYVDDAAIYSCLNSEFNSKTGSRSQKLPPISL